MGRLQRDKARATVQEARKPVNSLAGVVAEFKTRHPDVSRMWDEATRSLKARPLRLFTITYAVAKATRRAFICERDRGQAIQEFEREHPECRVYHCDQGH